MYSGWLELRGATYEYLNLKKEMPSKAKNGGNISETQTSYSIFMVRLKNVVFLTEQHILSDGLT